MQSLGMIYRICLLLTGQTISDVKAIWLVFTGDLEKTLGKAQQSEKETLETSASSAEASSTESFCDVAGIVH